MSKPGEHASVLYPNLSSPMSDVLLASGPLGILNAILGDETLVGNRP